MTKTAITTNLRVMSCNIRYFGAGERDGENAWKNRRDLTARVIRMRDPDLIGFQEMWQPQFDFMNDALPGYDWFGLSDTVEFNRPMNTIFWKRDRFQMVSPGGFFLSETPTLTGSKSWDALNSRLANWVRLTDTRTGKEFRLINTHLDHVGTEARPRQAALINQEAAVWPVSLPQILTGDMNCVRESPAIRAFLEAGWTDTHAAVHGAGEDPVTFHGFQGPEHGPKRKIDWVFSRGPLRPVGAEVVTDAEPPLFPSDHYFLCVDFTL